MFSGVSGDRAAKVEGKTNDNQIGLGGYKQEDFEVLLSVPYPREVSYLVVMGK
jgi:hypothetical protein